MDWFTLLLVFIFFVLPLIQQIVEARKRSGQPPELPAEEEGFDVEHAPPAERPRGGRAPAPSGAGDGSWSSDWGGWPAETAGEEAPARTPVPREAPTPTVQRPAETPAPVHDRSPARAERPAPQPRPEREVIRRLERVIEERAAPVEPTRVDRRSEHRRFHDSLERTAPARVERAGRNALAGALHDRAQLKRAILLSEVLGPPRALQPLERE